MDIKLKYGVDPYEIVNAIHAEMEHSRFNLIVDTKHDRRGAAVIKLKSVRMKVSRPYCGNHPNACENTGDGPPRKSKYLEGVDWVEFNDRINDVLDRYEVDAIVRSAVLDVRDGKRRRINYGSHETGFPNQPWDWDMSGLECDYADYTGRVAPASTYPEGTPGEYEREVAVR